LVDRYSLLQRGLFPETLPPCFTSTDLRRALRGITPKIRHRSFHNKRSTDFVRYNGTKHDGSRRYFGTPNPISYFYVADFIHKRWNEFEQRYAGSSSSVSAPRIAKKTDDRAIIVPSLSQLTTVASQKIGYSPLILKTDIAQFYPSIYTHSIVWSAHGVQAAKSIRDSDSVQLPFNALDHFVQNCQRGETRGLIVGPDAFRLIAEYIASDLDQALKASAGHHIVGIARHVDDFYIGLKSEADAFIVLSALREILQNYNLNINDSKTKIINGLEPLNEVWAQDLRKESRSLAYSSDRIDNTLLFLNRAISLSMSQGSDSPLKIALRTLDQIHAYSNELWSVVEPYLQRIIQHHSHSIDYVALLVVKRVAVGHSIDEEGWKDAAYASLQRHISFNHHHEIVWLLWLLLCARIEVSEQLLRQLALCSNGHVQSLLVAAFVDGRISRRPKVSFTKKLSSTDDRWLTNIVARSLEFTKASFGGALAEEFDHLAAMGVRFIDIESHLKSSKIVKKEAISRTRYGYDNDDEDDDHEFLLWDD